MLRGIIHSSSKICTRRTATSLYRCSSLRSFAGAVENNSMKNKETEEDERFSGQWSAHAAKRDAERCVMDHEMMIREIRRRVKRVEKAIESEDIPQISAAVRDLKQNLDFSGYSTRHHCSFPTELTSALLHRFGGGTSICLDGTKSQGFTDEVAQH